MKPVDPKIHDEPKFGTGFVTNYGSLAISSNKNQNGLFIASGRHMTSTLYKTYPIHPL